MAEIKKAKVVDKWKLKGWYSVIAPDTFDSKEFGQIVSSDEKNLKNRRIRIGLGELTGSFTQTNAFTTLFFRIGEIKGKSAYAIFIGHELSSGYIKTLLRRRRSIVYQVDDVVARDGGKMRIKSVAVTANRVSENVRQDIRRLISSEIRVHVKEMDMPTLVQEVVFGKLSSRVFAKLKKLTPMRRFELRKSELVETL